MCGRVRYRWKKVIQGVDEGEIGQHAAKIKIVIKNMIITSMGKVGEKKSENIEEEVGSRIYLLANPQDTRKRN